MTASAASLWGVAALGCGQPVFSVYVLSDTTTSAKAERREGRWAREELGVRLETC